MWNAVWPVQKPATRDSVSQIHVWSTLVVCVVKVRIWNVPLVHCSMTKRGRANRWFWPNVRTKIYIVPIHVSTTNFPAKKNAQRKCDDDGQNASQLLWFNLICVCFLISSIAPVTINVWTVDRHLWNALTVCTTILSNNLAIVQRVPDVQLWPTKRKMSATSKSSVRPKAHISFRIQWTVICITFAIMVWSGKCYAVVVCTTILLPNVVNNQNVPVAWSMLSKIIPAICRPSNQKIQRTQQFRRHYIPPTPTNNSASNWCHCIDEFAFISILLSATQATSHTTLNESGIKWKEKEKNKLHTILLFILSADVIGVRLSFICAHNSSSLSIKLFFIFLYLVGKIPSFGTHPHRCWRRQSIEISICINGKLKLEKNSPKSCCSFLLLFNGTPLIGGGGGGDIASDSIRVQLRATQRKNKKNEKRKLWNE